MNKESRLYLIKGESSSGDTMEVYTIAQNAGEAEKKANKFWEEYCSESVLTFLH